MIPQAYVERVAIGSWRPMSVPPAWRLRCLRAALAVLRSCCLSEGTGVPVDNIQEEFGGEPVAAFSMSHPAVPALYMVLTLGLTMFSMQPVLIALSLAGGLAYGFATRGAARTLGALRWQLPVILIQDFSLLAAQRPALNHPLRGWRQTALQSHPSDRY